MLMKIVAATGAVALVATAPAYAQTQAQAPADHWAFSITPYLWLPNINGTLNYSAPPGVQASPQIEIGPNDYLSDLKAAAMVSGEAGKGPWAIFTDVIYLKFDSEDSQVKGINFVSVGSNPVNSSLNAGTSSELEGAVWTLGGSYSLLEKHPGALNVLGGFRYFGLDASTDWNLTATVTAPGGSATFPRSGSVSDSVNLWDAIVGLRGKIRFGESAWSVTYYGDVGAGTESSSTYQWLLGLNYDWRWGGLILAYRELYYDQSGDRLVQNMRFSGPALGLTFRF